MIRATGPPLCLCGSPSDDVLAVLLRVFARPWSGSNFAAERAEKVRPLEEWLSRVGRPELEVSPLGGLHQPQRLDAALAEVRTLLGCAARSWSAGNPEDPATDAVMHDLALALFRQRLLKRPPPKRIDDCFGTS